MTSELTVTRRGFVKAGGALFVGVVVFPGLASAESPAPSANGAHATLQDPTKLVSWLEIHHDGTIVARTGKTETGTSASAFYAQVIAEELDVDPATITMIMGHTDDTPDGGLSAGFLGGAANVKKVAAMTRIALLGLASTKLDVPVASLTVDKGVVSGGSGKSVSYAELVKGQQLDLKIPVSGDMPTINPKDGIGIAGLLGLRVTGNPPTKPIGQYSVVGKSFGRPGIREIATGKATYSGDITVPGMLHARMVRPATLGATLVSVGKLDRARFATAEIVKTKNLVAVVSPNEWEAVQAARAVAADTTWTPWSGLPGSDKVIEALHAAHWTAADKRGDQAKVDAALAGAAKVVAGTFAQPYVRHAPIGAFVAVADAKADGSVTIWSQTSQPQGARAHIAHILGISFEKVTIRWAQGSGQYGRTTYGGDGAMADAAILSTLLSKPVRVQWTLSEDLVWSSASPAWSADMKVGLDDRGNMIALKSSWYQPHENDARMLGALLAGMPTLSTGVTSQFGVLHSVWAYENAPAFEETFVTENLAHTAVSGGLRGNIMRTPQHRQQNLALEGIITEAAAAAGVDPIEFRLRHTTNQAYMGVLKSAAEAHGWKPRPSPSPRASRTGSTPVTGRGVGAVTRSGGIWVAIADVEVTPSTGVVKLVAMTVGVDVGKVMNPRHLTSMMQGGAVMGVGEALFEEVTFDTGKVTSNDWTRYRIPRMGDIPEIKTVFTSRDDRGINGGGEAANAAAPVAIMAAFFDATGVMPRRIPLTPGYVKSLLNA